MSLLLMGVLVTGWIWLAKQRVVSEPEQTGDLVENLVAGEEWIGAMNHFLNVKLSEDPLMLFSDARRASLQAENFKESGLKIVPERMESAGGVVRKEYSFSSDRESGHEGDSMEVLVGAISPQKAKGKVAFLKGEFVDGERELFEALVRYSVTGSGARGGERSLEVTQKVIWKLKKGGATPARENDYLVEPHDWLIESWIPTAATSLEVDRPLFSEVTERMISDPEQFEEAIRSRHEEYLHLLFEGGEIPLKEGFGRYFTTDATGQHPGISVVDLDGDGKDEIYVCVRWGRNLLFRDRGDGTFEEVGADYGLDIEGLTTSAIFADFDNDGDQDVFLGRTLERSLYLVNESGFFVDRSKDLVSVALPYLTTSMAAADFNGDGLLDLYLSTYGFGERQPRESVARDFLGDYPQDEVKERFVSNPNTEPFVNVPGPPNVLLVNTGKGFSLSPLSTQVGIWRETLQETWGDFDSDGDPDLYVANDFAPDRLFRNDGGEAFVDVTAEVGHERMMGFGMGATFGDFDNDLDLDLYVSNMYSKAGLRITEKAGIKDQRLRWFAEGNLLFRNNGLGVGMEYLSGPGSPFAPVANADWSWGGSSSILTMTPTSIFMFPMAISPLPRPLPVMMICEVATGVRSYALTASWAGIFQIPISGVLIAARVGWLKM
jgi:hypothetical protein